MIRRANACDIPRLKELWRECFNESGDFFFDNMFKNAYVFDDGEIRSMLHVIEYCGVRFGARYTVHYFYGIGTQTEYRGRKIAERLINYAIDVARKSGVALCMLVPQEESLFDYYARFGFEKSVLRTLPKSFKHTMARAGKEDISRLCEMYEKKQNGFYLMRTQREWEIILDEGYDVFIGDDAYAIFAGQRALEEFGISPEYEKPTPYAAFLKLKTVPIEDGYFNILHD